MRERFLGCNSRHSCVSQKFRWFTVLVLAASALNMASFFTCSFQPQASFRKEFEMRSRLTKKRFGEDSTHSLLTVMKAENNPISNFFCDNDIEYDRRSIVTTRSHEITKTKNETTFANEEFEQISPYILSSLRALQDNYGSDSRKREVCPSILSEEQIKVMKVYELRQACSMRDLNRSGRKVDLQNRLRDWSFEYKKKLLASNDDFESLETNANDMSFRNHPFQFNNEVEFDNSVKSGPKHKSSVVSNILKKKKNMFLDPDEQKLRGSIADREVATGSFSNQEYLLQLTKTYNTSPHTPYSNLELKQLYDRAKAADINGDPGFAKGILEQLAIVTPHDGRITRRLARLYMNFGEFSYARELLQRACRSYPKNAHFWHGLANLEIRCSRNLELARQYFLEAIRVDPRFPNAYHALGTLEHQEGNLRKGIYILRKGIKQCPENHRLYHALGNIYIEANMLDAASSVFIKGRSFAPNWSQPFFYTSLAYVAYEDGAVNNARKYIRKAVAHNSLYAQGWIELGDLEESEGHISRARQVFEEAVKKYENIIHSAKKKKSLSGDKWKNVYQSWAKLEEKEGNFNRSCEIYVRACKIFPKDWRLLSSLANTIAKNVERNTRLDSKVKLIHEHSCEVAGSRHAEPYLIYGKYEMSMSRYLRAREIFFLGAKKVSQKHDNGLAELFHQWGVLELYYLKNLERAECLFDKALSLTKGMDGLRSEIFCSIARLEVTRGKYYKAKHYICLSIHNSEGIGSKNAWYVWAHISLLLQDTEFARVCKQQAKYVTGIKNLESPMEEERISFMDLENGSSFKKMICIAPWKRKMLLENIKENICYENELKTPIFSPSSHVQAALSMD